MTDKTPTDAAAWHARLNSDEAVPADFAAFEGWVASQEHRQSYDRLDRLVALLEAEPAAFAAALEGKAPSARRRSPVWAAPVLRRLVLPAALAAAVALVAAPYFEEHWTRYQTADRAQEIRLADGSLVNLNRNSNLRVRLEPGRRRVALDGEATFDVAHDAARPFTIAAGPLDVKVVGTEFNVLNAGDRTTVTVRRGLVLVSYDGGQTRLSPGQQCTADSGGCPARAANPDAAFAWRTGRLVYEDAPLADVIADLNRYYDRPVRAADAATEALRFSGVLVLDGEDKVVSRLEAFLPVAATRGTDAIVLSRAE